MSATRCNDELPYPQDVPFLVELTRKQQAALDAVRVLHVAEGNGNCITCWDFNADADVPWPCPTARALGGHAVSRSVTMDDELAVASEA